jgi:[protein-PII] uridylyltransferase
VIEDDWLERQLTALPAPYLVATPPARIAADLDVVRELKPRDVVVEGTWIPETRTVDYRIIAHHELADGCFHKMAGVLTAKHLEILSAQISTIAGGTVIDSFRVIDDDYPLEVPQHRIDEVGQAIRSVLTEAAAVTQLFRQHKRFTTGRRTNGLSEQPTRVVVDNDSSDQSTIIDVFAHDRPGLLYTISKALYEMGLSVLLAKIATHTDQVVDVFYVTDSHERKLADEEQLRRIRSDLAARLEAFENEEHLQFVS